MEFTNIFTNHWCRYLMYFCVSFWSIKFSFFYGMLTELCRLPSQSKSYGKWLNSLAVGQCLLLKISYKPMQCYPVSPPSKGLSQFWCFAHLTISGHFHIIWKGQTSSIFVFCPFSREMFLHKLRQVYWIWQVATVRSINHNVVTKELSSWI